MASQRSESMSLTRAWAWAVFFTAAFAGVARLLLNDVIWDVPEVPRVQGEALVFNSSGQAYYREEVFAAHVREPQNTWTNLAYVLVGAVIVLRSRFLAGRMAGYGLIFLGFGSGIYHASLMPGWRMVDVVGMYWVMAALVVYAFAAPRHYGSALSTLVVLGSLAAAVYRNEVRVAGMKIFDSTYVTVAFVVLALVLLAWRTIGGGNRSIAITVGFLAVIAVAGQIGDRVGGFWSNPASLVQGHSVWHVAGAGALGLFYEFFARLWSDRGLLLERPVSENPPNS